MSYYTGIKVKIKSETHLLNKTHVKLDNKILIIANDPSVADDATSVFSNQRRILGSAR